LTRRELAQDDAAVKRTGWLLLSAALATGACAGPPVASAIHGEPVCADFELGATHEKMQGGMRFPVQVTIKEGKSVQTKALVLGLRNPTDPPTRIMLPDADGEFSVEWAQCENERAPRAIAWSPKNRAEKNAAAYECGVAAPYKTDKLVTRKHDLSSHALAFVAPPKPECWTTEVPTGLGADAGAPPADTAVAATDASTADTNVAMTDDGGLFTQEQAISRAEQALRKSGHDASAFQEPKVQRIDTAYVVTFESKTGTPHTHVRVVVSAASGEAMVSKGD
jgi:hypothetical protein